ncbi:50S ribosomal protein L10 [Bacteroidia bacterium]|nr:50S ribosomal protein L10 [Bacteroidia bacterium]GHV08782.1 50S ribosomal protein L10 [Bacteroidia bacterium]
MKKEDKTVVIKQIATTLGQYSNFYLTDVVTLNAAGTSRLRRECNKEDIKLVVVKNTLFKKALEQTNKDFSALDPALKGNTAVMFSNNANSPAKLIKTFSKGTDIPKLKAAYVQEGFYIGAENLDLLISIKSKNELIADVIALLQSPAKNVISALSSGGQTIHGVLKTLSERG